MAKSEIDIDSEIFQLIERIKAVRILKQMTRQEFAQSLRVTGSFYSQVEKANNKPNAGMLLGIAKH